MRSVIGWYGSVIYAKREKNWAQAWRNSVAKSFGRRSDAVDRGRTSSRRLRRPVLQFFEHLVCKSRAAFLGASKSSAFLSSRRIDGVTRIVPAKARYVHDALCFVFGFLHHKIVLWRPTVLNLELESGVRGSITGIKMSILVKATACRNSQTLGVTGLQE